MLSWLVTVVDVLTVVLGFSFIIFVHELGHFVAARWAGIRVLAFAIGFGPAAVSYRQGSGFRRGSGGGGGGGGVGGGGGGGGTEYRLNWLPFGGYVRMLGQEDGDPNAVSDAPDSYQRCVPWKRMVVISAGVVMNVILAAVLFVIVFTVGLRVQPATLGQAIPGSPAAKAGVRSGDIVLLVDGEKPASFNDLSLASSMAARGQAVELVIERPGVPDPIRLSIVPEESRQTGLLELGLTPGLSLRVPSLVKATDADRARFRATLDAAGYVGVEPGMTLTAVNGTPVRTHGDFLAAFRAGGAVRVEFADAVTSKTVTAEVKPLIVVEEAAVEVPVAGGRGSGAAGAAGGGGGGGSGGGGGVVMMVDHLLGLYPVMSVADAGTSRVGFEAGDMFVRVGSLEYPGIAQGRAEIRAYAGRTIPISVLRMGNVVDLSVDVPRSGPIGFVPGTTLRTSAVISSCADAALGLRPGTTIVSLNGTPVGTLAELRDMLRAAVMKSGGGGVGEGVGGGMGGGVVKVGVRDALPGAPEREVLWTLTGEHAATLTALGYEAPLGASLFAYEEVLDRATSPVAAVGKGLHETKRVMLQTYTTFLRLFQGTVKVEHLKGPVGIAHVGTLLAERGVIWLLFFMALISVNLAVVNFLPLPIVDGGQFLFLVYEAIKGRPVPMRVQEIATVAGLCLIGVMFLVVTFNDVRNLLGV